MSFESRVKSQCYISHFRYALGGQLIDELYDVNNWFEGKEFESILF